MDPIPSETSDYLPSARLVLRPYRNDDGESYYNLLLENSEHLSEVVNEIEEISSIEDAEAFTRNLMLDWKARRRFVLAIMGRTSNEMMGQIWIEPLNWDLMIFEIGYFIARSFEGNGFVTEAVKRCITFLFDDVKAKKIEIHYNANNIKSGKVAESAGFTKEGQIRRSAKLKDGSVVDRVYYGLLPEDLLT